MTTIAQPATLWHHTEFVKLWVGQSISVFGSEITNLALPLTAAVILSATPGQMGVLSALGTLPFLLVGLFVGVWADRHRRLPILIMADLGRGLLLISIPVALIAGMLSIEYLYLVTFLIGTMTVFFDVSYQAFLPSLVGREHLIEGNSKMEISHSTARILGPGLAGSLIQLFTAPVAIFVDGLSFFFSALSLRMIRADESIPAATPERNVWREIREGLGMIFSSPLLRALAGAVGTFNFFSSMWNAVLILYITNQLELSPALIGIILAAGAPGTLLGALVARRVAGRFGLGRTIIGATLLMSGSTILMPLASGSTVVIAAVLIASGFMTGLAIVIFNVNAISLRQAITPNRLLGRMNASMRFLVWGTMPIGALVGGQLGEALGLRETLLVSTVGSLAAVLWLWFSPIRHLKEQPVVPEG